MSNPNQFWIRIVLVFVGIIAIVLVGRMIMLPDSWGEYGYYRGAYIDQEAHKSISYGTNKSCQECHSNVYDLAQHSKHKRLSCEICHAPITDHIKDGQKIATMPTKQGKEQVELCLRCHKKIVGRSPKIKTIISAKDHLEEKGVKLDHSCNQCHTVHAPFENINEVKKLRSLKEALNEN